MSNNLKYSVTKQKGNTRVKIDIRLNDECKNGHQDFAITGTVYEYNGDRDRWENVGCGCVHDDILEVAPELAPFVRLHLSDYLGRPMYAVENGFYHLQNGFNRTSINDPDFPKEYCEYYRITFDQFKALRECWNVLQFRIRLQTLGIIDQWKTDADRAIAELETLTGETFEIDSIRSNYTAPASEEIAEENQRIESGYYTPEAKAKRETERRNAEMDKTLYDLKKKMDNTIEKAKLEFAVNSEVLRAGGPNALKASIFYDHTKTVRFNWSRLDMIPETEANRIIAEMSLPEGVSAEIGKGN